MNIIMNNNDMKTIIMNNEIMKMKINDNNEE